MSPARATKMRFALLLAAAAPLATATAPSAEGGAEITVGAIRWAAWYGYHKGNYGTVGRSVIEDMSLGLAADGRWHDRIPFFGAYSHGP